MKKQLISGCTIIDEYLKAGYNVKENRTDVMGWCLNPETPFIKGACESYGLIPLVQFKTPHMEMRQNCGYRKQVFELLAKIISSFAIKNNIVLIEEAVQYGGWYNRYVYNTLIKGRLLANDLPVKNYFVPGIVTEEPENIDDIPALVVPTLEEIFGSLPLPSKTQPSMRPESIDSLIIHTPQQKRTELPIAR